VAGLVAEAAGDKTAGARAYEAALAREPALEVAQLHLAGLLAASGRDTARAVELAEAARREAGWSRPTATTLARALRAAGRAHDAVLPWRIALAKLQPASPETEATVLELAETLEAAGEPDEALALASGLVARKRREEKEPPWLPRARELRQQLLHAKTSQPAPAAPAP
jgi:tetratricopeptide (TPR) repeat protein